MRTLLRGAAVASGALVIAFAASSLNADILDDWAAVTLPPRPELKPVKLEGSTTALLILDMAKRNCSSRPRCLATVPNVKRLHDAARAAGAMLWYSIASPAEVIDPGFMPREGESMPRTGADKFVGSNLEEKLKARRIKTVIVCGTSFQGVGIGTGSGAVQRGYEVVIPIDCLSSDDLYGEQYAAWHFFKSGPGVIIEHVTLTRSTMVKF